MRHLLLRSRAVSSLLRSAQGPPRFASSLASPTSALHQQQQQQTELEDEYKDTGHAGAKTSTFHLTKPFQLESGDQLHGAQVRYTTYGKLNDARDNAIVLCHALTGHSLVHQWWDAIVTPQWTDKYFLICANVLGSCYGTTGPASIDPTTNERYGAHFPAITVRDAVNLQKTLLQEELHVTQVKSVIGGSMGGMQALEWAFLGGPDFVKSVVAIACNSHHTAWQIGVSEVQRQAIFMDPLYQNGHYDPQNPPFQGLALARQIAMLSYRTHEAYRDKYGRETVTNSSSKRHPQFQVQSYLDYQGQKFLSRFDVNSYIALTHLMDTHDVGRGRGGIEKALASLTNQPALVIGVESDVLYPLAEQKELAAQIPHAAFHALESSDGHDAFLLEQDQISALAAEFLDKLS